MKRGAEWSTASSGVDGQYSTRRGAEERLSRRERRDGFSLSSAPVEGIGDWGSGNEEQRAENKAYLTLIPPQTPAGGKRCGAAETLVESAYTAPDRPFFILSKQRVL